MSSIPLHSESQRGRESAALNLIETSYLRQNKERLDKVRNLLLPNTLSIDILSGHLQKLVYLLLAKGAKLVFVSQQDCPVIAIGDTDDINLNQPEENLLFRGQILEHGNNVFYPLKVDDLVIGYILISIPTWKRNDYFAEIMPAYADIIARELSLSLKAQKINAEFCRLERKREHFKRWQLRSRKLLHMVTHDLKSPLQAVTGYLQLLGTKLAVGQFDTKSNLYFEKIQTGLTDMSEVLAQINDLMLHINDRISVTKVEVELNWLVEEVLEMMKTVARGKKISLSYSASSGPVYAEIDLTKTKRIIYNLISNSIKYTPAGGNIEVSLKVKNDEILVLVEDDGYGISEDKMQAIFESYKKGAQHGDNDMPSSGLGLAISNLFAHILGGRISVESTPGLGSVFQLHLPSANQ